MNNKNLYDEGEINEDESQENEEEEDSEIIENNDDFDDENEDEEDKDITLRANIINGIPHKPEENPQKKQQKKEADAMIVKAQIKEENNKNNHIWISSLDDNNTNPNSNLNANTNVIEETKKELNSCSNNDLISILVNQDSDLNESPQNKSSNKIPINYSASVEIEKDFDVALTKILSKMVKEKDNNNEIYDILLSDKDKVEEELNKVKLNTYCLYYYSMNFQKE